LKGSGIQERSTRVPSLSNTERPFRLVDQSFKSSLDNGQTRVMTMLNGVVAMDLDSTGYEEPSTPLKDPTSSPAVHIQWQNSQSDCAAIEELRVASSVPHRREFTSCRLQNPTFLPIFQSAFSTKTSHLKKEVHPAQRRNIQLYRHRRRCDSSEANGVLQVRKSHRFARLARKTARIIMALIRSLHMYSNHPA
jgi:hypothetical protein